MREARVAVRLGAEAGSVDECFEAILANRGVAFTQASTQRFYDRPGLSFVPVDGLPPSPLAIAWRNDMDARPVQQFVETARILATLDLVPHAAPAAGEVAPGTIAKERFAAAYGVPVHDLARRVRGVSRGSRFPQARTGNAGRDR